MYREDVIIVCVVLLLNIHTHIKHTHNNTHTKNTDMLIYRRRNFTPQNKLKIPTPPSYCMNEYAHIFEIEDKQRVAAERAANKLILRITCLFNITTENNETVCESKSFLLESQMDSSMGVLRALIASVSPWEAKDALIYKVILII